MPQSLYCSYPSPGLDRETWENSAEDSNEPQPESTVIRLASSDLTFRQARSTQKTARMLFPYVTNRKTPPND